MEKWRRSGDLEGPRAEFRRPSSPPREVRGTFAVHPLNAHVTEVIFRGRLTTLLIEACHREFWLRHHGGPPQFILVDASAVDGYEPDIATAIARVIRPFRARGGQAYLMIASSGMLKMMGWAIASATRTPLRLFDSHRDALAYARAHASPVT